jgi:hypothetical protein
MSLLFYFKPLWRPRADYRPFRKQKRKVYRIVYKEQPEAQEISFAYFAQELEFDRIKRRRKREDQEVAQIFSTGII